MSAANPAAADPKTGDKDEVTLSVDELLRTREQLVTGLSNIAGAINEFIRSYVNHTNKWIGNEAAVSSGLDIGAMANIFGATDPAGNLALVDAKGKKRKRARKEKDPNAPKRPLTPFFLYSQHARAIVKVDMGTQATSAEINAEILRRWNEMPEIERKQWKDEYDKNAQKYREDKAAYDATKKAAAAEDDDAEGEEAAVVPAEEEEEEAPPPPPAKKAKAPSKKKADAKETAVPLPSKPAPKRKSAAATAAPAAVDKADEEPPKKKRARKSKADEDKTATPAKEPAAAAGTAEKKKRKKKGETSN